MKVDQFGGYGIDRIGKRSVAPDLPIVDECGMLRAFGDVWPDNLMQAMRKSFDKVRGTRYIR